MKKVIFILLIYSMCEARHISTKGNDKGRAYLSKEDIYSMKGYCKYNDGVLRITKDYLFCKNGAREYLKKEDIK
jgi:hypothetical protein